MKNFIALYHNTSGAHQAAPEMSAEQKEQMMAPWYAWEEKCGDQLVEMGTPVGPAHSSKNGNAWSAANNTVTGYSIVSASNIDEAQKLFEDHPIYSYPGHSVEISECLPM